MPASTSTQGTQSHRSRTSIVVLSTALMLFSMFFGAGNLIFPPMIGAYAGEAFTPAMVGFLLGGVALPIVAIVAIAFSGSDLSDLSRRAGRVFGALFPVLVYLSIGAFFGLPRMGAVAYSTSFVPLASYDSLNSAVLFSGVFFTVAGVLAWNPRTIIQSLGKVLTPTLLLFLAILILRSVMVLDGAPAPAQDTYATQPIAAGLLSGYLTMDSVAALAFGIIVVNTLRGNGAVRRRHLIPQTVTAAFIAGGFLSVVYVGLGLIGRSIPNAAQYTDGAALLADAAAQSLGSTGAFVFSMTVLAACLTTAVGLLAACSEFFHRLVPAVRYHVWLVGFAVIAFSFSIHGLPTLLAIAGPLIGFLYPIAITLMSVALIGAVVNRWTRLPVTFRLAVGVAVVWSAATTLAELGVGTAVLTPILSAVPLHDIHLGWVVPVALAAVCGLLVDLTRRERSRA
ncbi:branched-chain amino acid transport system II carrier protein [Schaalia sp. Marseille-Q2122]|uniref:branched-chain amino acid transport system II carrier protein n=1 Tax=Schaalia sp. Marseille-Q2122 TaxID=2736604 RepID=UPI00158EEB95|nr:branched-chain amino acid transport system II carrier protein [Schaalia sp. Marseille-Q2122]